ncbi:flippase [Roseivirga pacifica]
MLNKLRNSAFVGQTLFSFGGQLAFLLSNFVLFILMVKHFEQSTFGNWAYYITIISIADSFRQGFIQNGLTRQIIKQPNNSAIFASGTLLNYTLILALAAIVLVFSLVAGLNQNTQVLFKHGLKSLFTLGSLQFINTLCQGKQDFKTYAITNSIYFVSLMALALVLFFTGTPSLIAIINIQVMALVPAVLFYFYKAKPTFAKPQKAAIQELIGFGKYASGTNLVSLLFSKADVLMIGYFLDPTALAIYHVGMKIINYSELPLQALSQVIYPRISASYLTGSTKELSKTYSESVLLLLAFIIPVSMVLIFARSFIIEVMSSAEYLAAAPMIVLLAIAAIFKPWGRVFGLTLDAIGKPKVNFMMLLFSLLVNITMNMILIPKYGIIGAAMATSISIVLTIIIGQLKIKKHINCTPWKEVFINLNKAITSMDRQMIK